MAAPSPARVNAFTNAGERTPAGGRARPRGQSATRPPPHGVKTRSGSSAHALRIAQHGRRPGAHRAQEGVLGRHRRHRPRPDLAVAPPLRGPRTDDARTSVAQRTTKARTTSSWTGPLWNSCARRARTWQARFAVQKSSELARRATRYAHASGIGPPALARARSATSPRRERTSHGTSARALVTTFLKDSSATPSSSGGKFATYSAPAGTTFGVAARAPNRFHCGASK